VHGLGSMLGWCRQAVKFESIAFENLSCRCPPWPNPGMPWEHTEGLPTVGLPIGCKTSDIYNLNKVARLPVPSPERVLVDI
jgi:hypothetical protein